MGKRTISRIEKSIVPDAGSPSGERIIGFDTFYESGRYSHSRMLLGGRSLLLFEREGGEREIPLDPAIEEIDIYHLQYGIPVSDRHGCFFIGSWSAKGLWCCDLQSGKIRWNYRLKHATSVFLYEEYLVCAFQEIGLRKLSYEGGELAKYPMASLEDFCSLDGPYVFTGPCRGGWCILNAETMEMHRKIRANELCPTDENLIILDVSGTAERFTLRGFEGDVPIEREITLG